MNTMKPNKRQRQQGDLTMRKLASPPEGEAKVLFKGRCVLAEGESTGHAHVVEEFGAELIQIGERMLLKLARAATVVHEEHRPVKLQPGLWGIGRVSEYDYLSEITRSVAD